MGFPWISKRGKGGEKHGRADIVGIMVHAYPLRNFLKFNLPSEILNQPVKCPFCDRPSDSYNRNTRSALRWQIFSLSDWLIPVLSRCSTASFGETQG